MIDPDGEVARAVVSGGKFVWKGWKYRKVKGGWKLAGKQVLAELSTDWHTLDDKADTTTWEKVKASTDLIVGTNFYDKDSDQGLRSEMAQNKKQVRKRIASKQNQIDIHRRKIENDPDSRDVPGWEKEIRAAAAEIERLRKRLPNGR
jgi:hypothetical protein